MECIPTTICATSMSHCGNNRSSITVRDTEDGSLSGLLEGEKTPKLKLTEFQTRCIGAIYIYYGENGIQPTRLLYMHLKSFPDL